MIVYAALIPRAAEIPELRDEMRAVAAHLYARQPDTLVLMTAADGAPHSGCLLDVLPPCDIETVSLVRARAERTGEFFLGSHGLDDRDRAVLQQYARHCSGLNVLKVTSGHAGIPDHFSTGALLEDVLSMLPRRFALFVTADLANAVSAGQDNHLVRLRALQFDRQFLERVSSGQYDAALAFGESAGRGIAHGLLNPAALLFGALGVHRTRPALLGYASPRGIGHAVAEFYFGI